MLLAGDIGGTKTILALFAPDSGPRRPQARRSFASAKYPTLSAIVGEFMADHEATLTAASFGVAGPISYGRAQVTNLPWTIDAAELAAELDIAGVYLLNDLEAVATAIPMLDAGDVKTLHAGVPEPQRAIAVIAPGTGLGQAYLTWDGKQYRAFPCEGGHTGFGPESDLEMALWQYMSARFERVSYERVCSGQAIPDLYAFLRDSGRYPEPDWLRRQLAATDDPAPLISNAALNKEAEICNATLDLFIRILGSEAGNMVLKLGALGGVYLGGGIPPRILPLLEQPLFLEAFTRKGRFARLLERVPVHVILHAEMGLWGAARYGLDQMAEQLPA